MMLLFVPFQAPTTKRLSSSIEHHHPPITMRFSVATSLALLARLAVADFDLYSGQNLALGEGNNADVWFTLNAEPDCTTAWNAEYHFDTDDVSGRKLGIRCEGDGCQGTNDPAGIDVLEMHFTNEPYLHFSKTP